METDSGSVEGKFFKLLEQFSDGKNCFTQLGAPATGSVPAGPRGFERIPAPSGSLGWLTLKATPAPGFRKCECQGGRRPAVWPLAKQLTVSCCGFLIHKMRGLRRVRLERRARRAGSWGSLLPTVCWRGGVGRHLHPAEQSPKPCLLPGPVCGWQGSGRLPPWGLGPGGLRQEAGGVAEVCLSRTPVRFLRVQQPRHTAQRRRRAVRFWRLQGKRVPSVCSVTWQELLDSFNPQDKYP